MVDHQSGSGANQPMPVISVAAKMADLHLQPPYHDEELGMVRPQHHSQGNTRCCSPTRIEQLRRLNRSAAELGINLAGVQILVDMRERLENRQLEIDTMPAKLQAEISRSRKRLLEGL